MLAALIEGAEGVMIIGCSTGDSQHEIGSLRGLGSEPGGSPRASRSSARAGSRPGPLSSVGGRGGLREDRRGNRGSSMRWVLDRSEAGLERLHALREVFASERIARSWDRKTTSPSRVVSSARRFPQLELELRIEGVLRDEYGAFESCEGCGENP